MTNLCLCRSDPLVPLDVQLVFGTPHDPQSGQRFTASDRRLSLAMMTYVSSFVQNGSEARSCSVQTLSINSNSF